MPTKKIKAGDQFGYLRVVEYQRDSSGTSAWKCQCLCGTFKVVRSARLISNTTKSCGCFSSALRNESYYRNHPDVVAATLARLERRKSK